MIVGLYQSHHSSLLLLFLLVSPKFASHFLRSSSCSDWIAVMAGRSLYILFQLARGTGAMAPHV